MYKTMATRVRSLVAFSIMQAIQDKGHYIQF